MRRVGVVTVGRSDYGIYRPLLRAITQAPDLDLWLYVSGAHLSPLHGNTVAEIEADGFPIRARIPITLADDSPASVATTMGLGVLGFSQAFADQPPDLLVVLGDRMEMLAAVVATLPFNIPVAHIHGGEATEGAIDDVIRHSITKMSHLHFVATETYARRVIQMGEEPWRVHVTGAPALDACAEMPLLPLAELEQRVGLPLKEAPLLVTYHPVTREPEQTEREFDALLAALRQWEQPIVFTYPNADPGHAHIIAGIEDFVAAHERAVAVKHLGAQAYFSLMHCAAAMVGNSSSGIVEAASFALPVVNIGNRQKGRLRGPNVIDVVGDAQAILEAIRLAASHGFHSRLMGMQNPYGDGRASERIVHVLRTVALGRTLLTKPFHDALGGASQELVSGIVTPAKEPIKVVGLGAGGHAQVLLELLAQDPRWDVVGLLDPNPALHGKLVGGAKVLGDDTLLPDLARQGVRGFFVGVGSVGSTQVRQRLFALARSVGMEPIPIVHPTAWIAPSAQIGPGATILAGAMVNTGAVLGENVLVNTGAIVEHDCVLEDHVHVATGARLASTVHVGAGAHIGVGATVRQCIRIGANAVVGAGAVVVKDAPAATTVVGVPARPIGSGNGAVDRVLSGRPVAMN